MERFESRKRENLNKIKEIEDERLKTEAEIRKKEEKKHRVKTILKFLPTVVYMVLVLGSCCYNFTNEPNTISVLLTIALFIIAFYKISNWFHRDGQDIE